MAIRKVARMGHPVLRKKARELSKTEILSDETRNLVRDMVETMNEYGGIGIAAPQVHESVSIAVIDYQEDGESDQPLTVVINPKITVLDATEQGNWEGCLSVPEIRGLVYRPSKVQIDYLDLKAQPQSIVADEFLATVFQHELDHLFGVLFVDRIRYEAGKSPITFLDEYNRYHAPDHEDDVGEMED